MGLHRIAFLADISRVFGVSCIFRPDRAHIIDEGPSKGLTRREAGAQSYGPLAKQR